MLARSTQLLDQPQNLAALERFDPAAFFATARAELSAPEADEAKLRATIDGLAALAVEVDRFAEKSMRIRLVASIAALPRQLQMLLQTTVLAYANDLALLRDRAAAALARVHAPGALDAIMDAAGKVIASHAELRDGVAALTRETAAAWLPVAQRAAGERWQSGDHVARWQRAVEELETITAGSAAPSSAR